MMELLMAEELVRERMARHARELAHAQLLREAAGARRTRRRTGDGQQRAVEVG